jgi:AsmA protein
MTRGHRIGLIAAAVVVLLPLLAVAAFAAWFDADALKLRLADAVRRSTGRELTIAGPVGLTWSLVPTIALRDVALSNPPGLSRPAMARAAEVDVRIALAPLLSRRVEVRGVTLVEPDVLLERDAAGRPNWQFTPAPIPVAAPDPAARPAARMQVAVDAVRILDGRIGWRTGTGVVELLAPTAAAAAAGPGDPVALSGTLSLAGLNLGLTGTTGPLAAFGAAPWPMRVALQGGGIQAGANGTLGPGGTLALQASVADLAVLEPALGRALPPLHDVQASAQLLPDGLADVRAQAGAADLSAWLPGVKMTHATLTAPAMAQPVAITADALAGSAPVAVTAQADSLAALLAGASVPARLSLAAAGATVEAQGNLGGSLAGLTGRSLELAVSARVPDLAALGVLAGLALPPLREVVFDTRASATEAGAVALRAMRLASAQGDVSGDVVLGRTPRPSMRGTLASQRLDFGALLARPVAVPADPAPSAPAEPTPASPPGAVSPAPLLSDRPLPFYLLWKADADLHMTLNKVLWHGASYRAVTGRLSLQDGALRLDPVQAQAPGGAVQATLLANAAAPVPTVELGLKAPGLALGPILAGFGAPESMAGQVDADVQLKGSGGSVRAIAASLDGHLGLAMVDGELDNSWMAGLLGAALRGLPVEPGGQSAVRCLALRFDAAGGQAAARTMLLDATRLHLEGEGGMNLADETLDLRLRTLVRLGSTWVAAPVHLAGPWRAPRPQVAAGGPARGGLVIGATPGPDACPAQLAAARDGQAGPMPAAGSAPAEPRSLKPADLLRSLLR